MRSAIIILAALCTILSFVLAARTFIQHRDLPAENTPQPAMEALQDPTPTPAPINVSDGDLVLDLFNPSEASLSSQLNDSTLKARLEDTITLGFILRRCKFLTSETYNDTHRALVMYIQRTNPGITPLEIKDRITSAIEASNASYGLIYSRLSCDLPQLTIADAQLAQWREAILNPPQR